MVVIQAERFAVDLVKYGQRHVQILHAPFHVFDSRVDIWDIFFDLLEVLLDITLLHSILILDIVFEVLCNIFERQLILLLLVLIDALPVFAPSSLCLRRPHAKTQHHLPLNMRLLHLCSKYVAELLL